MFILSQDKTRIFNTSGHIEGIGYKEENFKEGKKEEIRHTIQVFGGCAEEIAEYKCKEDCLLVLYAIFNAIEVIGVTGSVRRATVIEDYAFTITTRQDRTPAQVIDCGKGRYRYLTELECWRLQGYTDEDFERAKKAQQKKGRYYTALYKQAGNSIAVPIFESIFRKIILNEVREKEEQR